MCCTMWFDFFVGERDGRRWARLSELMATNDVLQQIVSRVLSQRPEKAAERVIY